MVSIYDWAASASGNAGSSQPTGFANGQPPSAVSAFFRNLMAFITEGVHSTVAGGTADALTVTLTNVPASLTDGMHILVRAANANATTAPTLNLNSLGALTITKLGGAALVAGDIAGNLHELSLRYNSANTRWELMNPAKVSTASIVGNILGSNIGEAINAQTGTSYTVGAGDQGKLITFTNAGAIAVTLPQATGSFANPWWADFACLSSSVGAVTITPTTSTIDGASTLVLQPGRSVRVVSDGTNYQVAKGYGKLPTRTVLGSGSGTYTTPAGAIRLMIRAVGGGGGGAGSGSSPGNGGAGGNTTFGTSLLTAPGGGAGTNGSGGAGGTPTGGDINLKGGAGQNPDANLNRFGGNGGCSAFGGFGPGGTGTNGQTAGGAGVTSTGSGGGGAGDLGAATTGGGGGAGGYLEKMIVSPNATYAYAIGAAGTAGTNGTGGDVGGAGGSGLIDIIEFYT